MKKKKREGFIWDWKLHLKMIFVVLLVLFLILAPLTFLQHKELKYTKAKLYALENEEIISYNKYTLNEFEEQFGLGGQSMAFIEAYIVQNGFEDKTIGIGYIQGVKTKNCKLVESQGEVFCERTVLTFNQRKGLYVEVLKKRVIPNYSSLR